MNSISRILLFLTFILLINACKKDDDAPMDSSGQSGAKITTSFTGIVRDIQGNPMPGVLVSVAGKTVASDAYGIYSIQDVAVDKKRAVILAAKSGYWNQQRALIAEANSNNYSDIYLYPDNKAYTVNAVAGGTVTLPGGTVLTFPTNAFVSLAGVAYTGTVYLTAHEIQTTDPKFLRSVPGGDMLAEDASGTEVLLLSYGMAGAELYDMNGNKLQVAAGKQVNIKMPINPQQLASAPATIPLWHYNESKMMWEEDGLGTRNGNFYEGNVSHFSWWNYDAPCSYAYLYINLKNCSGQPYPGAQVNLHSLTLGTGIGYTNSNGVCSGMVPPNQVLTVTVWNPLSGLLDTTYTVGPFTAGSQVQMPPIQLYGNCTQTINGTLTNCNNVIINGTVAILINNQPAGFVTTTNGTFNYNYTQTGTYVFLANVGQLTGSDTIVISSSNFGQQVNLQLGLCDTISTGNTNFSVDFVTGSTHLNYSLNVTDVSYQSNAGQKQIVFTYLDSSSMSNSELILDIPDYLPATYNWNPTDCGVSGNFNLGIQTATITSSSGITKLYSNPAVGGYIIGLFNGQVTLNAGGLPVQGNLSATFNVLRTQ